MVDRHRFIVFADEVKDRKLDIFWKKHAERDTERELLRLSWPVAQAYAWECNKEGADEHGGWRLPSVEELSSLLEIALSGPEIFSGNWIMADEKSNWFWTSSRVEGTEEHAWLVGFGSGMPSEGAFDLSACVRLVRNV